MGSYRLRFSQKRKMGWEMPNWLVLLRFRLNQRVSWEWKDRSERVAGRVGTWVEVVEVNSEHLTKPKNARRNIYSKVESMNGDEYPEQRVKMQRARRSTVRGKRLGESLGSALCRPLISIVTWG